MPDQPDKAAMIAEAYRRGLLDNRPEMKAMVEEGMRRGLIPSAKPEERSSVADFVMALPRGLARGAMNLPKLLSGGVDPESAADIGPSRPEALSGAEVQAEGGRRREQFTAATERAMDKLGLPEPQGVAGQYGETIGEFIGDPASYLGPGGVARKALQAGIQGAAAETAGQLTGQNPAARVAGGVLSTGVFRPPRPALPTSPERMAQVRTLRAAGVEPSAGDLTGRRWLKHGEEMGDYLGGGRSYTQARTDIGEKFTNAIAKEMGEDVSRITPDVLESARKRIGNDFSAARQNMHINVDKDLIADGTRWRRDLAAEKLPAEAEKRLLARFDDMYNAFTSGRGMSGRVYQAMTAEGTPLQRAIDDVDPNVRFYAERIRNIVDKAALRSAARSPPGSPARQAVPLLNRARSQWFHYLIAADATSKAGEMAQSGLITPQNLRAELARGDRRLRYALNRSRLAPLSRAGNIVLPQERSSGTAERFNAQRLHQLPQGVAGRIINAPPVQRYLKDQTYRGPIPARTGRALATGVSTEMGRGDPLAQDQDALQP